MPLAALAAAIGHHTGTHLGTGTGPWSQLFDALVASQLLKRNPTVEVCNNNRVAQGLDGFCTRRD